MYSGGELDVEVMGERNKYLVGVGIPLSVALEVNLPTLGLQAIFQATSPTFSYLFAILSLRSSFYCVDVGVREAKDDISEV